MEMSMELDREQALVNAARIAFDKARDSLGTKNYGLFDYMHSGNQEAMGMMLGMKDAAINFERFENGTEEEIEEYINSGDDDPDGRLDSLGFISMKTPSPADGERLYPEFVILENADPDDSDESEEALLEFGGMLSGKAPPAAVEATVAFIVEVTRSEIMPEITKAVELWKAELKSLSDEGMADLSEPRIICLFEE